MDRGLEHGSRHHDYFSRRSFICRRRNKWPAIMSKSNSTLWRTSHWLVVYTFRIHSYIPCTYTTNVFHSHRNRLNWDSQLNTQIWKFIYSQWLHCRKLKHSGEALDDHTKELVLDSKITDKHELVQDTLPYCYNPYFITPLSTIFDTSITARKHVYRLFKTDRSTTSIDDYTIFSTSKPLRTWLGIQSAPSLSPCT